MYYKCVNGIVSEMTDQEVKEFETVVSENPPLDFPTPQVTDTERIDALEETIRKGMSL